MAPPRRRLWLEKNLGSRPMIVTKRLIAVRSSAEVRERMTEDCLTMNAGESERIIFEIMKVLLW